MKKLLLLTILIFSTLEIVLSQTDKEKAMAIARNSIVKMNEGKYEEAIEMLEEANELDPESIVYEYEIAYAYYSMEEYEKVIDLLEDIIDDPNVYDLVFQLLGNSYDNLGEPDEAMNTYKKGLEKFPNSGKLYLEQGIVEYYEENYNEAINYWENGVNVEPSYSSNYFWLGKIFSYSEERIWSVIFGEIFINLEPNTNRTIEMSKILYDVYSESLYMDTDTSASVSFTKRSVINPDDLKIPFSMRYELTMALAQVYQLTKKSKKVNLEILNKIRESFINNWYEQELNEIYQNPLFDYQKKLYDNGHFEAYNYWFLMKGNENEFDEWYKKNEKKYDEFISWYLENPLELSQSNYFSITNSK